MTNTTDNNPRYIYNRCRNCGSFVETSHRFCPNCGVRMEAEPPHHTNPQCGQFDANDAFAASPAGCSRGVAALLAIFLGTFGIHYFYVGKKTAGFIMLGITLVSCFTLSPLTQALSLAQGIYMFIINNREFYNKYVATPETFPLF